MSLRYIRPPTSDAAFRQGVAEGATISFYPIPVGTGFLTVEYCLTALGEVAEALRRSVASGVVEYHIGSRGLKRFTLKELQDLFAFWKNAANDAMAAGFGSAIQTKRAVPCDV
jgi:hypothetical protein